MDRRKVGAFVGLAFGVSWVSALALYLADVDISTAVGSILLVVLYMWAPAVAAVAVRLWHGEGVLAGTGVFSGRLRWLGLAWITPVFLLAATVGLGALHPDVSFTTDPTLFLGEMGLSDQEVEEALTALEAVPGPTWLVFVVQGLVAGLTVNAVAALGEELGWRGFLLDELSPLGFWRVSILTGLLWGFWHAPIVLQGHNFPNSPVVGVFVMAATLVPMSMVYTYLTVRAGSVFAAVLLHGSFNGLGSLSLVYLTGGSDLLVSPVGFAGFGAATLASAACVVHDRWVAEDEITTGDTLSPWS